MLKDNKIVRTISNVLLVVTLVLEIVSVVFSVIKIRKMINENKKATEERPDMESVGNPE